MPIRYFFPIALLSLLAACNSNPDQPDAYGNFEADELIVSAEIGGRILQLDADEGQTLKKDQLVGRIDSTQLVLKREQLEAAIQAVTRKSPAIREQLNVFDKQENAIRQKETTLIKEKDRITALLKNDAATGKQLDDLDAQLVLLQKELDLVREQKTALNANLEVQKSGLLAEILPLRKQIEQVDDQIARCRIHSPIDGTVLNTYALAGEITGPGKPLLKIAPLDPILLRAYISGEQLAQVKIGQQVQVAVDGLAPLQGQVTWIADKAEFTPKIIQTKEERTNLVYAVKVKVPNDGSIKIGMPGELRFSTASPAPKQ